MLHILDDRLWFPPVEDAMEDGLLAIGGHLTPDKILYAYQKGIFPWYEGDVPLWWSPDPRFVLFPQELKVSKSMKVMLKRQAFSFTINQNFSAVIKRCAEVERPGQEGTWITPDVISAYTSLHTQGFAISAEAQINNELAGGLYGVIIGKVFFGESMFSKVTNASKFAFIKLVEELKRQGIELIDCQVYTEHLESMGARMIARKEFIELLKTNIG
ncbi:MAG: leucyl/phenylalanyl-tRNA--protein transferase [Chitinophagaceae bacterium]|nr:leucyl/phenylalanyl-tRNA--protein transferase [Chitinophagaceae bacterium]